MKLTKAGLAMFVLAVSFLVFSLGAFGQSAGTGIMAPLRSQGRAVLAANAVTTAKLATGAVTADVLAEIQGAGKVSG